MSKTSGFTILFCLAVVSALMAQTTDYDQWIRNEGFYLLTSGQKQEFQKMTNPEKEVFIRNLWANLDSNPLTPENEFKVEYEKRFEYAKKHYGIPSDRAKIYILLGPPNTVESHPNSDKYFPLELWSYFSLGFRGIPPSLELIFFKRWGVGDYRLYSPLFDGFKALTPSNMDFESQRAKSQMKAYFDPQIVEAAEHITVGASINESETIRMVLQDPEAMKRVLNQNQRPSVETTVVYQGFDSDVYTYSVPHEGGIYRTSISIAVPPKHMTFEKDQGVLQGRIDLSGKISDEKGNEVLRITDSPYIKMSEADFEKAKAYIFAYQFDSYLLPGKYNLDCLFRDFGSNTAGKIEKSFEIKPINPDLQLLPPLLAFKTIPASSEQAPFVYDWKQFYPKENVTFNNGTVAFIYTGLLNPQKTKLEGIWNLNIAIRKGSQNALEVSEELPLSTSEPKIDLIRKLKLESLIPGDYVLTIQLSRDQVKLIAETPIKIGDNAEVLGRMRIVAPYSVAPENYHTNLALQFLNQNDLDQAARHVRIALDFAPSSYAARGLTLRIEKAKGNLDTAIPAYEKLLQESPSDSEGRFVLGKWYMEKQQWSEASQKFKEALAVGYYTTDLLNALAFSEMKLGKTNEAVEYWQKSLALNENQPEIQKQVEQYKQ